MGAAYSMMGIVLRRGAPTSTRLEGPPRPHGRAAPHGRKTALPLNCLQHILSRSWPAVPRCSGAGPAAHARGCGSPWPKYRVGLMTRPSSAPAATDQDPAGPALPEALSRLLGFHVR